MELSVNESCKAQDSSGLQLGTNGLGLKNGAQAV